METGKTGKYLKYAIGEIILVVIGILIALSINNWNENKKLVNKEVKILKEIKYELEGSLNDLTGDIEDLQRNLNSAKIIRNTVLFNKKYNDSLNRHFLLMVDHESLTAKQSAFESLQSIGLEIISNDSIRQKITTAYLYMRNFTTGESDVNKSTTKLFGLLEPYMAIDREKLISDPELINRKYWGRRLPFKLINYAVLLKDEVFLNNLMYSIESRSVNIYAYKQFKKGIEELVSNINQELKRLE
jgi:Family of unknown function (DUF6090)